MGISGIFAVTFSVVFSYIADCTREENRSFSYGMVSLGVCVCGGTVCMKAHTVMNIASIVAYVYTHTHTYGT